MILINTSRIKRILVLLGSVLAASACGFRLEGSGTLPVQMARTYVETSRPTSAFTYSLRTELRTRGLHVVERPDDATARLIVTEDATGQRVLSVSARNIPREYEIFYAVTFALETGDGRLIEGESLTVTRSYTFDETQVLGKAREERVLRQALADDLARQVVRRIEALRGPAVVPAG
jgi:LPS-assembly lipoprotein